LQLSDSSAVTGRSKQTIGHAQKKLGKNGIAIAADVTKSADLDSLFQQVREKYGRIDVLYAKPVLPSWAPSRRQPKKSSMTFSMPTSAVPTSPCKRHCHF
jgi:NAD(P)-dependent dehydrogenase (short-subunit alcohol dehydrogenase family)